LTCTFENMYTEQINQIRIAVTGSESTGKTTLAKQLAELYDGQYIPEFAREYVEKLPSHYTFQDVETIARTQVEQYLNTKTSSGKIFIFDTWLIITKVWFKWVFGNTPDWFEDQIRDCPIDLYLLCCPDLPWEADSVRENGGENRMKLFEEYRNELTSYGCNFVEIPGVGDLRLNNAIAAIRNFYGFL
jgi:NadR type nicotinamide-nucleotide adenylyltransferase